MTKLTSIVNSSKGDSAAHRKGTFWNRVIAIFSIAQVSPFGWTAIASLLRFLQLGRQSLWLDELFSVFVSRRDLPQVIAGSIAGDTNPPLFNMLLHFSLQFGSSEILARFISALFGIATVPMMYVTAKQFFGSRRIANIAAAIVVFSPFQITYAQEARMYALLGFLQLASIYFFYRAWKEGKTINWLCFSILQLLAFYAHSLAILGLLAVDGFALLQIRRLREKWRPLVLAHVIIALCFAPWAIVLVGQAERVLQGFWDPSSTVLNLVWTPYLLFFANGLPRALVPVGLLFVLQLVAMAIYLAVTALRAKELAPRAQQGLELAMAVSVIPPLVLLALSVGRPIYVERVLITSSYGFYLLLAWSFTRRLGMLHRAAIAISVLLFAIALGNYFLDPDGQKAPMRQAAQLLEERLQPGDMVVHASDWSALAFDYYLPDVQQHFLAGDPDYLNPTTRRNSGLVAGLRPEPQEAIVRGHPRVWLVVWLDHSEAYQQGVVDEFDTSYRRVDVIETHNIYMFLYNVKS